MTFVEYVSFYQLARSEGMVLRYLADAYKALRQTVPEEAKTEELGRPHRVARRAGPPGRLQPARRVGEADQPDRRGPVGGRGRAGAGGHAERAGVPGAGAQRAVPAGAARGARAVTTTLGALDAEAGWDADAWADALEPYFDEHDEIRTGPDARGPEFLIITEHEDRWEARQIFDDPAGDGDWGFTAEIDLAESDEIGAAAVRVTAAGQL